MTRTPKPATAIIGAAHHGGWAVLVTVAHDGTLLDRRRVELLDAGLPSLPHHHEGQVLPLRDAVDLVERVRASAERHARQRLAALAGEVPNQIVGIAVRHYPPLPPTVAERITDYRAQCVADSVMYRDALADAGKAKGWFVHWYDSKSVFAEAAQAMKLKTIDGFLQEVRKSIGPPWQKDHKVAMAAAIAAAARRE